MNMCVSYTRTLSLVEEVSKNHTVPLQEWITKGHVVKFWGDNVDKMQKVRDLRSDNQGEMVNMYSIIVGQSRTPAPQLSHIGRSLSDLSEIPLNFFLPSHDDVSQVKGNLAVLVSRIITQYITSLAPFAKLVPQNIQHLYSKEMSKKSEVFILDVLMKNEAKHTDMIDIMTVMHNYLGDGYADGHVVVSGGDHLTCERQIGSQRHLMYGNTRRDRLELLEPVVEDWHALVCLM